MASTEWIVMIGSVVAACVSMSLVVWKIARPHIEKAVRNIMEPLEKKVDLQGNQLKELEGHDSKDHHRVSVLEKQIKAQLKASLAMLLHMSDDNHTGEMAKAIKNLQEELIDC